MKPRMQPTRLELDAKHFFTQEVENTKEAFAQVYNFGWGVCFGHFLVGSFSWRDEPNLTHMFLSKIGLG